MDTVSVLFSSCINASELAAVRPGLSSLALLQIFEPAALINGSILVFESTLSVSFVVEPVALIALT